MRVLQFHYQESAPCWNKLNQLSFQKKKHIAEAIAALSLSSALYSGGLWDSAVGWHFLILAAYIWNLFTVLFTIVLIEFTYEFFWGKQEDERSFHSEFDRNTVNANLLIIMSSPVDSLAPGELALKYGVDNR